MVLESSGTILYVAKISNQSDNQFGNCQGGPNVYTDKQTNRQTHTHTHTNTHKLSLSLSLSHPLTHTPKTIIQILFVCGKAQTRQVNMRYKSSELRNLNNYIIRLLKNFVIFTGNYVSDNTVTNSISCLIELGLFYLS